MYFDSLIIIKSKTVQDLCFNAQISKADKFCIASLSNLACNIPIYIATFFFKLFFEDSQNVYRLQTIFKIITKRNDFSYNF